VVQEDLVADIADAFMSVVKPLGCAVTAVGKHDCVAARGVRCPEASMTTVALRGIFSEDENYVQRFSHAIDRAVSACDEVVPVIEPSANFRVGCDASGADYDENS